jgi:hypothetical protein
VGVGYAFLRSSKIRPFGVQFLAQVDLQALQAPNQQIDRISA